ncbi:zinc-binding dehydrogenase [Gammaproteobacteria bacterium 45_16_T64]|nr:zinc-binding dehydrogenase [Gammaproteobacteria bacterium 45_16_T64]
MKGLVVNNKRIGISDELSKPTPKNNEALVKVMCSSINPTDVEVVQGKYDFWLTLLRHRHPVKTGLEFSGVVVEDGKRFKKNDNVFGYINLTKDAKTHQEYLCIPEDYIARIPNNLSFEQAAALPLGALTTLVALQELGKVKQGANLLINGASGGLGVYAVQIGKILGATVTAVAGPGQKEFLRALGADEVINYDEQNVEGLSNAYDVLLDLSNKKTFRDIQHVLSKKGIFIPAEPDKDWMGIVRSVFSSKKSKILTVLKGDHDKLTRIANWVEEGKLNVFVDSVYDFSEYENAFQRLSEKGRQGRIVINIHSA